MFFLPFGSSTGVVRLTSDHQRTTIGIVGINIKIEGHPLRASLFPRASSFLYAHIMYAHVEYLPLISTRRQKKSLFFLLPSGPVFVSFDDPSFFFQLSNAPPHPPPQSFRGGVGNKEAEKLVPSPNNPPFCNPPLWSGLLHPPPGPLLGVWCLRRWCVCTVQLEKQLKRRGKSSTRTILLHYSSIIPPIFRPSFHSLHLVRSLSLSISV